jgi:hypothetical protein
MQMRLQVMLVALSPVKVRATTWYIYYPRLGNSFEVGGNRWRMTGLDDDWKQG